MFLGKLKAKIFRPKWPRYSLSSRGDEPMFLFVFTPPYSGSTALVKVLRSVSGSMGLTSHCEGQWLVPGLCSSDRWDPSKQIDWKSVRSVWFKKVDMAQRSNDSHINFVIEKSPPNLVRYRQILRIFPEHRIIVFNRNPYASCASRLYREHNANKLSSNQRIRILVEFAKQWLVRSASLREIVETCNPVFFTYEDFCADVDSVMSLAKKEITQLEGVDPKRIIQVKDYAPAGIEDQNPPQISMLSRMEVEAIGEVFATDEALLAFFGYTSRRA